MKPHCGNIKSECEMHLSCLIPFLIRKNTSLFVINTVIVQIVILIMSSPSCIGFYVMRWRMVIRKKNHVSSLIQYFVFSGRKTGCIRCTSSQVYNKKNKQ